MTQTLSDDEFIQVWLKCEGNGYKVSKAANITERQAYRRRNNVEMKRGIALPSGPKSLTGRPKENESRIGKKIIHSNYN